MSNGQAAERIKARYRSYCDACESGRLVDVPAFWSFPALFTVDMGDADPLHQVINTPEEMVGLYSKLFGDSTGVDETLIDSGEVTFFGDKLAMITTELRHLVKGKLHDKQKAIYGCRRAGDDWVFISHLSVDIS